MRMWSPMFITFGLITAAASAIVCSVYPANVVAAVGEEFFLSCTTMEGFITSWDIGMNALEKNTIYTALLYKSDGTIRTTEKVAEGYFVTRPADNETNLHIKKTILSQAGLYVCTCDLRITAVTTVVVLDSEPKFTTDHSGENGELVTFSCSVSFNASSDVSCQLTIEDASGFTVGRGYKTTMKNGLIACNVRHEIIANASSDQWYTCKVTISVKGDVIYSRVLNATVPGHGVVRASKEEEEETVVKVAIILPVAIIVTGVFIITVVICRVIRAKNRKDKINQELKKGQPGEPSSNRPHRPAHECDKNWKIVNEELQTRLASNRPHRPAHEHDKSKIGGTIPKDSTTPLVDDNQEENKSLKANESDENEIRYTPSPGRKLYSPDGHDSNELTYAVVR